MRCVSKEERYRDRDRGKARVRCLRYLRYRYLPTYDTSYVHTPLSYMLLRLSMRNRLDRV